MIRLRRRPDPAQIFDDTAAAVERLAALVQAGSSQQLAWTCLAETGAPELRAIATAAAQVAGRGEPVTPALPTDGPAVLLAGWRRVAALADLATASGAPVGDALRRAATGLRGAAELQRSVATSVAGPAASARVTTLLPPGCALLGWAFGFDVPSAMLGSPVGGGATALAALLLVAAHRWSRRLIRRASAVPLERGLGLDLVALGVRAGLPTALAVARCRETAVAAGLDVDADLAAVDGLAAFAGRSGAPLAALLDAEADRVRRETVADGSRRASVLGVHLLLPLGALVLPAFLLAGALPIGIAVLSSTTLPF